MLSLVALTLVAIQTPGEKALDFATPIQAAQALDSLGYSFIATNDSGSYGKLTHDGKTVVAFLDAPPPARKGDPAPPVRGIQLLLELGFPQEVPLDIEATNQAYGAPEDPLTFTPHLGRTVSVRGFIDFERGPTAGRIRSGLDRFWKEAAAYAKAHGGVFQNVREPDWTKARFPEGYVLSVADERSLNRLTDFWGWTWRKNFGASSPVWLFPIEVEGREVIVSDHWGDDLPKGRVFDLQTEAKLPPGVNAESWIASQPKQPTWATSFTGSGNSVSAHLTLDLRKGVTLGDLHRRILEFARRASVLQN